MVPCRRRGCCFERAPAAHGAARGLDKDRARSRGGPGRRPPRGAPAPAAPRRPRPRRARPPARRHGAPLRLPPPAHGMVRDFALHVAPGVRAAAQARCRPAVLRACWGRASCSRARRGTGSCVLHMEGRRGGRGSQEHGGHLGAQASLALSRERARGVARAACHRAAAARHELLVLLMLLCGLRATERVRSRARPTPCDYPVTDHCEQPAAGTVLEQDHARFTAHVRLPPPPPPPGMCSVPRTGRSQALQARPGGPLGRQLGCASRQEDRAPRRPVDPIPYPRTEGLRRARASSRRSSSARSRPSRRTSARSAASAADAAAAAAAPPGAPAASPPASAL